MGSYLDQTLSSPPQTTRGEYDAPHQSSNLEPTPYQPRRPRYNDDQARRRLQESGVGDALYDQVEVTSSDARKNPPYQPDPLTPPLSPCQSTQSVVGQRPLPTPPNRQDAGQRIRLPFTPGYGVLHSGPVEPLPPLEERVNEAGVQHRIYPAPTEISPPENIDVGWPDLSNSPSWSQHPQSPKTPEAELVSGVWGLDIQIDHDSETESQFKPPEVTPSSPGEKPKRSGSYIPWEPVRYSKPLPDDETPTREEMLETLGRMKRHSQQGPKAHSPNTPSFPIEGPKKGGTRREEGWGTRTKQVTRATEDTMDIDDGGWGEPPIRQEERDETGWGQSPASEQAFGGWASGPTGNTSAPQLPPVSRPAPRIHPDRLKMIGGAQSSTAPPSRKKYPPSFDAARLGVRQPVTGPRQGWGERMSVGQSRFDARPPPPHLLEDTTMAYTPDDGGWGGAPSSGVRQTKEDHGGW